MRKLVTIVALSSLLLSACNTEMDEAQAQSTTPKVIEANLEEIPYPYQGYVTDKRSGCLYTANWGDRQNYLTEVNGANGEVVGCRENASASSIEDYFGK